MFKKKKPGKDEESQPILVAAEEFKHRDDRKATAGLMASLLNRLGLGSSAGMAQGVQSLGTDLLASKAGFTALLLGGYTAAIGTGMIFNFSGGSKPSSQEGQIYGKFDKLRVEDKRFASSAGIGSASGGASAAGMNSIDYFQRANKGAMADGAGMYGEVSEGEGVGGEDAPEVSSGVEAPDNSYGSGGVGASGAAASRPKLKASKTLSIKSSGSTGANLSASKGVSRTTVGGTNNGKGGSLRSGGGRVTARQSQAASRNSKRSASTQVLQVRKTLKSSLAQATSLTSASSGLPYDGGRGKVNAIGSTSYNAVGVGPSGAGGKASIAKASTVNALKDVEAPPKIKFAKNMTPYQGLIMAATLALAAATAMMFMANWLKAKSDDLLPTNPTGAAAMLNNVKMVAGAATLAAMGVVAVGMQLMNTYDQQTQGLTFVTGGSIILMRAGMVLVDSLSARKNKEGQEIKNEEIKSKNEVNEKIHRKKSSGYAPQGGS